MGHKKRRMPPPLPLLPPLTERGLQSKNNNGRGARRPLENRPAVQPCDAPRRRNNVGESVKMQLLRRAFRVGRGAQLAEQAVVNRRSTCRQVAAVVHMMGAVHTRHSRPRHHLMAVERGQHRHRHKHRQQEPRRNLASHTRLHSTCKISGYPTNSEIILDLSLFYNICLTLKQ